MLGYPLCGMVYTDMSCVMFGLVWIAQSVITIRIHFIRIVQRRELGFSLFVHTDTAEAALL